MRVDETTGPRWELALERLAAGYAIYFRGVSLSLPPQAGTPERTGAAPPSKDTYVLLVVIKSTWTTAAEQTPERARADIARAEYVVEHLLAESPAFADLVADREIEYHTADFGIYLAGLRGERFTWTGPPHYGADQD
jgi:hypothetical protein